MENEIAARALHRALGSSTTSGKCVIYQPYRRYVHFARGPSPPPPWARTDRPGTRARARPGVMCSNNGNIMRVKCNAALYARIARAFTRTIVPIDYMFYCDY